MSRVKGFTLIETVVMLAVLTVIAFALATYAFVYLRDAKIAQAQNDAQQIAAAIGKVLQDTGLAPYKNTTSAEKKPGKEAGDFDCLRSGAGSDFTAASDATGSWTSTAVQCQLGSTTRDTIDNHLINNTPGGTATKAYKSTGKFAWRGPYLPSVPSDPWGNQFLVNIGKADPSAGKAVWVISAGPNGKLETPADLSAASVLTSAGDDIVVRVK